MKRLCIGSVHERLGIGFWLQPTILGARKVDEPAGSEPIIKNGGCLKPPHGEKPELLTSGENAYDESCIAVEIRAVLPGRKCPPSRNVPLDYVEAFKPLVASCGIPPNASSERRQFVFAPRCSLSAFGVSSPRLGVSVLDFSAGAGFQRSCPGSSGARLRNLPGPSGASVLSVCLGIAFLFACFAGPQESEWRAVCSSQLT